MGRLHEGHVAQQNNDLIHRCVGADKVYTNLERGRLTQIGVLVLQDLPTVLRQNFATIVCT